MAVGDCVGGAGFDAKTAENAARIIDVVDGGVAVAGGNAVRFGVFCGFNIDAICGARSRTQETGDTLLETVFVPLQNVNSAVTGLYGGRGFGKALRGGLAKEVPKGDAKSFI